VVDRYVRTGRVKLVYRGIDHRAELRRQAGRDLCGGAQNKLWNLARAHRRQAPRTPIDQRRLDQQGCRRQRHRPTRCSSRRAGRRCRRDDRGEEVGLVDAVRGTPTFLIERPASPRRNSVSALDPASFTAALDAALR
jgi:hypothetical protein